ncbi:MAG TPA: response regulator [Burkholderiales bacterium]
MSAADIPVNPQDIYARTAEGSTAMDGGGRPLSAGFREMLKAIDGVRTVEQVAGRLPRLDAEDVTDWLRELLRMKLIDFAEVPFDLPESKAAPRRATTAPAAGGEFDVAAMAANVEEWLKQDTEAFRQVPKVDLAETVQSAALQSTQALETLKDSGFFANLLQPLSIAGRAPARAVTQPVPRLGINKGPAIVFESDAADSVLLTRLLNGAGYQAQLCSTRQQLVLLLNQVARPDVIFLKLGAKDVDVFKVLEKLRVHHRLGKTPVVMMADAPSREDIAKSILLGASGWMAKPYTAEVIQAALKGVLAFPQA